MTHDRCKGECSWDLTSLLAMMITLAWALSPEPATALPQTAAEETYRVQILPEKITVQFDTAMGTVSPDSFCALYPILDAEAEAIDYGRGCISFTVSAGADFAQARDTLIQDGEIVRVHPVYTSLTGRIEYGVTDMLIVKFNPSLSINSALALLYAMGLHFEDSSAFSHLLWRVALDDTLRFANTVETSWNVSQQVGVDWCTPDSYSNYLNFSTDDPYYENQYYLENSYWDNDVDIDADSAWMMPLTQPALRIALTDEAVGTHEDIPSQRLVDAYSTFSPNDPLTPGANEGHGIACAGIIAAEHNNELGIAGVMGTCELISIKTRKGDLAPSWALADGIWYAQYMGARVLSMSVGYEDNEIPAFHVVIKEAIEDVTRCPQAGGQSMVIVGASGNFGQSFPGVCYPANLPEVISVGAISSTSDVWPYSNRGSWEIDTISHIVDSLEVVAPSGFLFPNGDVWSTDQIGNLGWNPTITGLADADGNQNYTGRMGGTSAAAPQVAGIAGLILAKAPHLIRECSTFAKVKEIITMSAEDRGTPGWDPDYGWGSANAFRALLAVSRGDLNNDGAINVQDVILAVSVAWRGGDNGVAWHPALADLDCNGFTNVQDVVAVVNVAFRGHPLPTPCYEFEY